jgi:ketosteroid isomerase-like protein
VHGDHYDNRCIGVFTVDDDRIMSVIEYADTRHVAAVLFREE